MKKLTLIVAITILAILMAGCASLPDRVSEQSRKDFVPTEEWKAFDSSGEVKFLQVQTTAKASDAGTGMSLDGSMGEMLIEIKTDPVLADTEIIWKLKNKKDHPLYVVAVSPEGAEIPFTAPAGETTEYKAMLDAEGYGYIVVDSDAAGEVEITASVGDKEAKTTRGSTMKVLWF